MSLRKYQEFCESMWVSNADCFDRQLSHGLCGLTEEVGELHGLFKRVYRGDRSTVDEQALIKELGDVIYYWTILCSLFDLEPETVLQANIEKLTSRKARGVIQGSGDNR